MAIILKPEHVARFVFFVRGEKAMFDFHLAGLYGVETRALKQAVRRNRKRFPTDFMFELSEREEKDLVSQNVIPGRGQLGGARPMVFTEQGVAMLSSVLRSPRAVEVNIAIMRTFVQLRRLMDTNADLARKIEGLEKKYDEKFAVVFAAIKQLIAPPEPAKKRIGFHPRK
jgi:ORF6N domain